MPLQFTIRGLLLLTAVAALLLAAIRLFGWLNVALVVLHPFVLFVYWAAFVEWRKRRERRQ